MKDNTIYLEAEIQIHKETASLKEKASKVIKLPKESEKQPDLAYFSAIFVSSGENLNNAFFMGSELVAAQSTIVNKALDVEHSENEIIGHLYERAFIDTEGNQLDLTELSSKEIASLDTTDMHIAIAGIIYKSRFPHLAKEVADNKWKVSMECYYQNYDIKIGDLILDRQEAEALGLMSSESSILGKAAKVIKKGKEIASGTIARVLRGICFSGCGIVKNPANPPSIILETAGKHMKDKNNDVIVLNYDLLDNNNVTLSTIEDTKILEQARDGMLDDSVGICVSYKKRVLDKDGKEVKKGWCSAYEKGCTAFGADATDYNCLRNEEIRRLATASLVKLIKKREANDRRKELLVDLEAALREAVETQSR